MDDESIIGDEDSDRSASSLPSRLVLCESDLVRFLSDGGLKILTSA